MKLNALFSIFKKPEADRIDTSESEVLPSNDSAIGDARPLIDSGIAKAKSKDYLGALQDFDEAIRIKLNCTQAYIDIANAYLERSKVKSTLKDNKGAQRDHSQAGVILEQMDAGFAAYNSGLAKYNSGDYTGAILDFDRAVECGITTGGGYLVRGLAKEYSDDFNGAVDDFTKAIERKPSDAECAEAFRERGLIRAQKLHDAEGALQDYDMAIRVNPSYSDAYYSRAMLKDNVDAMADLDKAISLAPTDAKVYFYRSLQKCKLSDFEGAIQDMTTFIELDPTDSIATLAEAYTTRGSFKFLCHDYQAAIKDASKAIELDPTGVEALANRAEASCILEDWQGGILDYSKLIELDPSNAAAYHCRGLAKLELGMEDEGRKDLIDAIGLGYEEEE